MCVYSPHLNTNVVCVEMTPFTVLAHTHPRICIATVIFYVQF